MMGAEVVIAKFELLLLWVVIQDARVVLEGFILLPQLQPCSQAVWEDF
jgi:hypothetical protein